jgi:predicted NAD/FAD-dependent oxidoreductase
MISLAEHLAEGLDVRTKVRVRTLERTGSTWELLDEQFIDLGGYDQVIVTVPAPQATLLLDDAPGLQRITEQVFMAPAWAGLFVFEGKPPMDFDGAFVTDSDFTWVARNASKPGRPGSESWVVHMSAEWTRLHWTVDRAEIPSRILSSLQTRFGPLPPTIFERVHRWAFSRLVGSPTGALYDADLGIGVAGDWSLGRRVEGALVSGLEVADRALERLGVGARSTALPVGVGTIR